MSGDDTAWQALIRFVANGCISDRDLESREPWDIETYPPRPKRTRKRRMTLSRAMRQASEAGIAVGSVTINTDGSATLTFVEPGLSSATEETSEDLRKLL
ncbi:MULTISPECIES: hypothetical protein [unclassified Bradyrhizobium]|uniref:hypothetical protein n=1 Tax=unclassified Bradyrhizobium TaxID=2631580 RepID=UPI001FF9FDB2|nr:MULTISPECIES: hypothetical protein [unclassified Bradyrhizobium]MCK1715120.1 hypothetical protein [Bradyrhizobium sp. 143]MCK1725311.1 hypothetical protein [Bradyrhizobium sp. 142]